MEAGDEYCVKEETLVSHINFNISNHHIVFYEYVLLRVANREKIGMSVALYLTFAVFGSILSDAMPKDSEKQFDIHCVRDYS